MALDYINRGLKPTWYQCLVLLIVSMLVNCYNVEVGKVGIAIGQPETQFGYSVAIATTQSDGTV